MTPHFAGGQRALLQRMAPVLNVRHRAITGGILWLSAALLCAIQQLGSFNPALPTGRELAILVTSVVLGLGCLTVGPRFPARRFAIAEQLMLLLAWTVTIALVASTGGATSPDLALFANTMFYCAYFLAPRWAAFQICVGTLAMMAPFAYDLDRVTVSGFIARVVVMTSVLWAMSLLILRNKNALQAAEMNARRLALTDPLTGVANLRTFNAELQDEFTRAEAAGVGFGIAFVDVNGLKAANTVLGHAGGDTLIKETSYALLRCAGESDHVARIGGDEFAVLVPGADANAMTALEQRFALALLGANGPGVSAGPRLSASVGTAVFPEDGSSLVSLMRVADERMYDSKSALPTRLPTPETSGGRTLSDSAADVAPRWPTLAAAGGPIGPFAWILGAALLLATQLIPKVTNGHLDLCLALAGSFVVIAANLALAPEEHRASAERLSNALAVVSILPVIYATGGATTAALPLVYLVVAHASYALSPRAAVARTAMIVGLLAAPILFGADVGSYTSISMIAGEVIVIAFMLQVNRRAIERAERAAILLSNTDALTGLANRRVFERLLAREGERLRGGGFARATRVADMMIAGISGEEARATEVVESREPTGGLILIDVDNFKEINTAAGHQGGDNVLRMVATVLDGAVGAAGKVCRIGGDEFAVVAESGEAPDLMRLAAKCRAAVQTVDWRELYSAGLTVSVGYAAWSSVDEWKDLVIGADMALQMSKDSGKDAVSSAPERPGAAGPFVEELLDAEGAIGADFESDAAAIPEGPLDSAELA